MQIDFRIIMKISKAVRYGAYRFDNKGCKDCKNRNLSEEFEFERNNFGF